MPRKLYTILILPHSKSRLRKLHLSRAFVLSLAGVLATVALIGASGSAPRLRDADGRVRATFYRNDQSDGRLVSLAVSSNVVNRVRFGLGVGRRTEELRATGRRDDLDWISTDVDVVLTGGWLLLASSEWSGGDSERTTQYHVSAIHRF